MKKRRISLRIIFGILLIIIGSALVFQNRIRDFILNRKIEEFNVNLEALTLEDAKKNREAEASFDFESLSELSLESVLNANQTGNILAIGEIAVPSVGINLSIAKGVSDINMTLGAGTLREDQVMGQGNYVLASHHITGPSDDLLFTPLHRVNTGEKIYISDLEKVYVYEIYSKELVDASRVDLVEDTEEDIITLITCEDLSAINRLIVRGKLIDSYSVKDANQDAIDAFKIVKNVFK